jgi:hypothetical protein
LWRRSQIPFVRGLLALVLAHVEFLLLPLGTATIFAAVLTQHAQQLYVMAVEEGNHAIVQEMGRYDRGLAIVELGASNLGVSINKGLLTDASHSFQVADIEGILSAAIGETPAPPSAATWRLL